MKLRGFIIGHKKENNVSSVFKGEHVIYDGLITKYDSEKSDDDYKIDLKFKVGFVKFLKFTPKFYCDLKIPLSYQEGLKPRVFEVSLADLQNDKNHAYRKIRLRAEDIQGKNVLTNFWGMDFTTDKLRSLVKKWQSLIDAHVDVKTTDNYTLRMFCIGFTKKRANQVKRTCYAQSSQILQIHRKMREIMVTQAQSCDLKELALKFIPESIGREIEKATSSIYPLQNVFICKVNFESIMEAHGDYSKDVGVKVDRPSD
ncbi:hypothetical protein R6Q59_021576 [Mikania micrantha]